MFGAALSDMSDWSDKSDKIGAPPPLIGRFHLTEPFEGLGAQKKGGLLQIFAAAPLALLRDLLKDCFAEGVFVVETQGFKAGGPERQLFEGLGVALFTGRNLDLTADIESPDHAGSGLDLQVGKGNRHKGIPLVPAAL